MCCKIRYCTSANRAQPTPRKTQTDSARTQQLPGHSVTTHPRLLKAATYTHRRAQLCHACMTTLHNGCSTNTPQAHQTRTKGPQDTGGHGQYIYNPSSQQHAPPLPRYTLLPLNAPPLKVKQFARQDLLYCKQVFTCLQKSTGQCAAEQLSCIHSPAPPFPHNSHYADTRLSHALTPYT